MVHRGELERALEPCGLAIDFTEQRRSLPESVVSELGQSSQCRQSRFAVGRHGVVERLILVERLLELRVAISKQRIELAAEIAAIGTSATKPLAVSRQGGQEDRAGQVRGPMSRYWQTAEIPGWSVRLVK